MASSIDRRPIAVFTEYPAFSMTVQCSFRDCESPSPYKILAFVEALPIYHLRERRVAMGLLSLKITKDSAGVTHRFTPPISAQERTIARSGGISGGNTAGPYKWD